MSLFFLQGEAQEPAPPPYKLLRSEEDYRYFRDPARRTDVFDPVRHISFDNGGGSFLTLGGDLRLRYEYFRNPGWGEGPDHPSVSLETSEATTLTVDWDFFWRQCTNDGIYGPSLTLARTGQSSDELYIDSQLSVSLECRVDRHAEVTLFYAHFFAGPFLRETPPEEDVDFLGTWITYGF